MDYCSHVFSEFRYNVSPFRAANFSMMNATFNLFGKRSLQKVTAREGNWEAATCSIVRTRHRKKGHSASVWNTDFRGCAMNYLRLDLVSINVYLSATKLFHMENKAIKKNCGPDFVAVSLRHFFGCSWSKRASLVRESPDESPPSRAETLYIYVKNLVFSLKMALFWTSRPANSDPLHCNIPN